jgi:hypothetical protein
MKSSAVVMCLACLTGFGQATVPQGRMGPPSVMLRRADSFNQISKAVDQHQSFQLPDNSFGSHVTAIATRVIGNSDALILIGVEIRTSSLIVTADEAIYDWDTHQIEPRGNVRLKSVTPL